MNVSYCDVCGVIFKPNDERYALVIQKFEEEQKTEYKDAMEYLEAYNRTYGTLKVQEVCGNCKKVYDHFFNMRKGEVEKVLKQISKTYKLKIKKGKNGENKKI